MKHVILCGGVGSRLWPLSHSGEPKQLLRLFNQRSLLQETVTRNKPFCSEVLIIANKELSVKIEGQIQEVVDASQVSWIREPKARNTAAAIAMAALCSRPDDVLLVTPSDHLIEVGMEYTETVAKAKELAVQGNLVTIGLKPAYPETGFGYIHYNGNEVIAFTEKPNLTKATEFVNSGNYLWNSGIFCFTAKAILEELALYEPVILEQSSKAVAELKETGNISHEAMEAIPSQSIDYAVMERSSKIKVVPSAMDWSDVGTYESLVAALQQQEAPTTNAINVQCESTQNFVFSETRPVAILGLDDIIVVDRPNGLLIMKKGMGQHVKDVYQQVEQNFPEAI